jgi:hypothetical protein
MVETDNCADIFWNPTVTRWHEFVRATNRVPFGLVLGIAIPLALYGCAVSSAGGGDGSYLPLVLLLGSRVPFGLVVWPVVGALVARRPTVAVSALGLGLLALLVVGVLVSCATAAGGGFGNVSLRPGNPYVIAALVIFLAGILPPAVWFAASLSYELGKRGHR